jgi:hypothetical protein
MTTTEPATSGTSAPFGPEWKNQMVHQAMNGVRAARELAGLPPMPTIACLCGSTRFVDVFNRYRKILTEAGEIVLSIEVVTTQARGVDPQHCDPDLKARLDELHKRKIDLADRVLVVSDETGYFGESTQGEIRYALEHGKPVKYAVAASEKRARDLGLIDGAA